MKLFSLLAIVFTAQAAANPLSERVLERIEVTSEYLFVSETYEGKEDRLVIPVSKIDGESQIYLFEVENGAVTNVAIAVMDGTGIGDIETHGGIASYERVREKISFLITKGFRIISSKNASECIKSDGQCILE